MQLTNLLVNCSYYKVAMAIKHSPRHISRHLNDLIGGGPPDWFVAIVVKVGVLLQAINLDSNEVLLQCSGMHNTL